MALQLFLNHCNYLYPGLVVCLSFLKISLPLKINPKIGLLFKGKLIIRISRECKLKCKFFFRTLQVNNQYFVDKKPLQWLNQKIQFCRCGSVARISNSRCLKYHFSLKSHCEPLKIHCENSIEPLQLFLKHCNYLYRPEMGLHFVSYWF